MKKKLFSVGLITMLCLSAALAMTACGGEKTPYSDYDLSEYVKVGNYKGMEYEKTSVSVSAEEVQKEIDSRLESHATTESVKEGTVEDNDVVNIDYAGTMDGKSFDGGSAKGFDLTIGSGQFIDGFEDGLIGKAVGDKVTLNLTFPESYGKNGDEVINESQAKLAGKAVTFEVTINSRKVQKTPAYDMDFVKKHYSDYDSLDAFEKGVKKELLEKKQEEADLSVKQKLWKDIVDSSEVIKYPEEMEELNEKVLDTYKNIAKDEDMEWEEYLKSMGYTEEELLENTKKYAEGITKEEMILYSIAKTEGLEVTGDEYDAYLDELLEGSGMDEKTFESSMGKSIEQYAEEYNLRETLLLNKVMDKVMEYGKVVE